MNLSAASSLNKIIIAQNCSAVMTVFDLDTPHLNSGSRSEFSGATKPNSSWSQTQLTRPIVALVEAGSSSSFTGGFFLDDFFGQRIVEVNIGGNEITAVTTSALGGGLAIDSDASTQRIFLQVDNSDIYILSSQFIEAIPEPSTLILFGSGMVGLVGCCLWRARSRRIDQGPEWD